MRNERAQRDEEPLVTLHRLDTSPRLHEAVEQFVADGHGTWLHTDTGERRARVRARTLPLAFPDTDQAVLALTRLTVPDRALGCALLWRTPDVLDQVATQTPVDSPGWWLQRPLQDALLATLLWLGPDGTVLASHGCRTRAAALQRARTLLTAQVGPSEWYRIDIASLAEDDLLVLAGFAGSRPL